MKYGFVKTAAATPEIKVADCSYNAKSIIELAEKLSAKDVELLLMPQLCLTSKSCGDLYTQPHFIKSCDKAISEIADTTKKLDTIIVFGAPIEQHNSLYNCAIVMYKGIIHGAVPKQLLNSNNCESRWFTSGTTLPADSKAHIAGQQVPMIVNGIFRTTNFAFGIEIGSESTAPAPPAIAMATAGAEIILNPAADTAIAGTHKANVERIIQQSSRYKSAYIYAGSGWGESTSSVVYPGFCTICETGETISKSQQHTTHSHYTIAEVDIEKISKLRKGNNSFVSNTATKEIIIDKKPNNNHTFERTFSPQPFIPASYTLDEYCQEIFNIQASSLAKRIKHIGAKNCVIGISGGLDSTLALLVTAKACDIANIPHSNIIAVTMPGFGTSDRTYNNAITLMKELGTTTREICIKEACIQHFKDINHDIHTHDITYENAQARERTQILMDIANQTNGIVIGTGDLSELALGWATYNGDQMSMYGVNASVPKTLMQHIVRLIAENATNNNARTTLLDIVDTPISPELTPADDKGKIKQKTEDLVGPYELHDFFIYHFLNYGYSPTKIHAMATVAFDERYDRKTIKKWLTIFVRRFFAQQFKRAAMPDGPMATCCSLSPQGGWLMTSDTCCNAWLSDCEAIE